jgi:hypothetical protein
MRSQKERRLVEPNSDEKIKIRISEWITKHPVLLEE